MSYFTRSKKKSAGVLEPAPRTPEKSLGGRLKNRLFGGNKKRGRKSIGGVATENADQENTPPALATGAKRKSITSRDLTPRKRMTPDRPSSPLSDVGNSPARHTPKRGSLLNTGNTPSTLTPTKALIGSPTSTPTKIEVVKEGGMMIAKPTPSKPAMSQEQAILAAKRLWAANEARKSARKLKRKQDALPSAKDDITLADVEDTDLSPTILSERLDAISKDNDVLQRAQRDLRSPTIMRVHSPTSMEEVSQTANSAGPFYSIPLGDPSRLSGVQSPTEGSEVAAMKETVSMLEKELAMSLEGARELKSSKEAAVATVMNQLADYKKKKEGETAQDKKSIRALQDKLAQCQAELETANKDVERAEEDLALQKSLLSKEKAQHSAAIAQQAVHLVELEDRLSQERETFERVKAHHVEEVAILNKALEKCQSDLEKAPKSSEVTILKAQFSCLKKEKEEEVRMLTEQLDELEKQKTSIAETYEKQFDEFRKDAEGQLEKFRDRAMRAEQARLEEAAKVVELRIQMEKSHEENLAVVQRIHNMHQQTVDNHKATLKAKDEETTFLYDKLETLTESSNAQLTAVRAELKDVTAEAKASTQREAKLKEQVLQLEASKEVLARQVEHLEAVEARAKSVGTQDASTQSDRALQLASLKKDFFFSAALAIKLHLAQQDQFCNLDMHELFEAVQAKDVPFVDWPKFISDAIRAEWVNRMLETHMGM